MRRTYRNLFLFFLLGLCLSMGHRVAASQAQKTKGGPEPFESLRFRLVGPWAGGRVARVTGVAGNPLVYYAATASGGVWKSTDGGYTWKGVFDDQPTSSIGSIAVAPSDPNIVYVGSGEANIRGNVAAGKGIFKSVDGGETWVHVWKQEGQIGTMVVHPRNPDIAFAAVLGHAFGPNRERGVYRTTDGGKSWKQVLYKDERTGASDVSLDRLHPSVVFAGLWQARRRPWDLTSGGPGSGLYVSRDGGESWIQLTKDNGLPDGIWGKVGVAVAPSDSRRVYALIEAEEGGLFRSDDGGATWTRVSAHHSLRQRPWYYSTLTIDPANPDIVWFPQVPMLKTVDGGKTLHSVKGLHHGDHHDLWIDPEAPSRMIAANDGGVDITLDGGGTWFVPPLPIGQFYHVATDNSEPYRVLGAMQDLGTASGPSNSLSTAGIQLSDWYSVGGGEAGHAAAKPDDPHIVYAGEYGGYISRYDHRSRQARNVSIYPEDISGHGAEDLKFRFQWTAPIATSPHDPSVVYHAANVLFRSTDGGETWDAISADLTRNDKSKQKWAGGPITGDNTGVEIYCTIFAVAESPLEEGLLWVGSDDGLVHVSRDGGRNWTNVTSHIPGMPEWGTVRTIEPSHFDAATAYLVVDAHRLDDTRPYLWKTTDYGGSWTDLASGLPQEVYLHAVREDPKQRGMLYLGTERGVAYSRDDGASWTRFKLGLPTVAVHDLVIKNDDLVVGTHGRSIWIFDDLTPLRQMSEEIARQKAFLFPPRPAKRWRYHYERRRPGRGQNPPRGAILYYYLKQKPEKEITLEILDAEGNLIRTLRSTAEALEKELDDPDSWIDEAPKPALSTKPGVQRAVWDLGYEGAMRIPHAEVDMGNPKDRFLALPGTYTLRLNVDGDTYSSSVAVEPDPRVSLDRAALEAQRDFALEVRDAITRLAQIVEQVRSLRKQVVSRLELWRSFDGTDELVTAAETFVAKCDELEGELHNPKAEIWYDILAQKGGAKLYSRLSPLYSWALDSDGPPTEGMREQFAEEKRELEAHAQGFEELTSKDLTTLNEMARALELSGVLVPKPPAKKR